MSRSRTGRAAVECLVLLALVTSGGCFAPYSKQALPMRLYSQQQAAAQDLRIGAREEMSRSGLRLFTWPLDLPSAVAAIEELIDRHQAVGIANLEVDFHEWSLLYILSFPRVTVSGNLVLPGPLPPCAARLTAPPAADRGPPRAACSPPRR